MPTMDSDETEICNYLKGWPGQFVSGREIARRAAGKWRYRKDPHWAIPVLVRLVEMRILEADASGYYRLRKKEAPKPKQWISPQIKAILEKSGKTFEILDVDEEDTGPSNPPR
jgi:hypothetical protein